MNGIDVREIKLELRYPNSRQEDVTDAFMRGYMGAVEIGNKAIEKLEDENAKLRELIADLLEAYLMDGGWIKPFEDRAVGLGVEVDG